MKNTLNTREHSILTARSHCWAYTACNLEDDKYEWIPRVSSIGSLLASRGFGYALNLTANSLRARDASLEPFVLDASILAEEGDGQPGIIISVAQIADMNKFMKHPAIVALVRLNAVSMITGQSSTVRQVGASEHVLKQKFEHMAEAWCQERTDKWSDYAGNLWADVVSKQDALLRPLADGGISEEVAELLDEHFHFDKTKPDVPPVYVDVLTRLADDPQLFADISNTVVRARSRALKAAKSEFDVHGDDSTARFDELYVRRTLVESITAVEESAESVLDSRNASVRAVVIGDPGTGKSTLIRWFTWRLIQDTDLDCLAVPITVICREHLSRKGVNLVGAIQDIFGSEYGERLPNQAIEVLLATGCVTLIFDGLDEILNVATRESIVNQIVNLAVDYPMVSILCTTRRAGFEVQALKKSALKVYSLEQYSDSQVKQYAEAWFAWKEQVSRAERFLGESRNLPDLRQNPLMLALLCTLYSQQDYIPQSRREIYLRCASLMFREWDPKRGIDIPNIFKSRGEAALQAVARQIERAGGYGTPVRQDVLEGVVRDVLEKAGVDSVAAHASARELLDHCATRAWILSARVADDGQREFGFTHRTFFEFYAAEAVVREINRNNALGAPISAPDSLQISPVTRAVRDPFVKDPTSVMPELIIQAADDLMGGVSAVVLTELINLARFQLKSQASECIALAVRLLAAVGSERNTAKRVLDAMTQLWVSAGASLVDDPFDRGDLSGLTAFRSFLDIQLAHRSLFREMALRDNQVAAAFVQRYARIDVAQEIGLYSADWRDLVDELPGLSDGFDHIHTWFDVARGKRTAEWGVLNTKGRDLFRIGPSNATRPGVFWIWLEGAHDVSDGTRSRIVDRVRREALALSWDDKLMSSSLVPEKVADSANAGILACDLALVLMLLTKGDRDLILEHMAGAPLSDAARRIRSQCDQVNSLGYSELENGAAVRREIRSAWRSVIPGRVVPEVWQIVGLQASPSAGGAMA